ncbi:methyltransferase domain-containing protein [Azospirillum sp. TSH58]|uniref:glucosamine inositolphosphorylceramide transferase family protein n=1 Tax=Azospirillum sp. TSH58 TaxID=664962 RepID=UPI0011B20C13|nr:methyltransferase domain-containing protein [Azospirillum sp. TSH58]
MTSFFTATVHDLGAWSAVNVKATPHAPLARPGWKDPAVLSFALTETNTDGVHWVHWTRTAVSDGEAVSVRMLLRNRDANGLRIRLVCGGWSSNAWISFANSVASRIPADVFEVMMLEPDLFHVQFTIPAFTAGAHYSIGIMLLDGGEATDYPGRGRGVVVEGFSLVPSGSAVAPANPSPQREARGDLKRTERTTLFFSAVNRAYDHFVVPWAFSILYHHDDALVEVCVQGLQNFIVRNDEAIKTLHNIFGTDRLVIREGNFANIIPNTVRFVEVPISNAHYVYIGDIDIFILESNIPEKHLSMMEQTKLPYSNIVRPNSTLMTGLHFSRFDAYYPLPDISDIPLDSTIDENVLYEIVRRKVGALPSPGASFRPVHGIHMSPNRPNLEEKPGLPGWGITPEYISRWLDVTSSEEWLALWPFLSPSFKSVHNRLLNYCLMHQTTGDAATPEALWPGSTWQATQRIRHLLSSFIEENRVGSLCDAGCGNANWVVGITGGIDSYLGIDIDEATLSLARSSCFLPGHRFERGNMMEADYSGYDAVLSHDALSFLSNADILRTIDRMAAGGGRFLMLSTYPALGANMDSPGGAWRPINLTKPPFNLPEPLHLLPERQANPNDPNSSKSIGVWMVSDLLASRADQERAARAGAEQSDALPFDGRGVILPDSQRRYTDLGHHPTTPSFSILRISPSMGPLTGGVSVTIHVPTADLKRLNARQLHARFLGWSSEARADVVCEPTILPGVSVLSCRLPELKAGPPLVNELKQDRVPQVADVVLTDGWNFIGGAQFLYLDPEYDFGGPVLVYPGCERDLEKGMINLDFRPHRKDGLQATLWEFHMGLRAFEADSVDGITISHMMMYVPISQYHEFFKDCFRVLKRGGVLRVTEDNANLHRAFECHYSMSPSSPSTMRQMLEEAGFRVFDQTPHRSVSEFPQIKRFAHPPLWNEGQIRSQGQTRCYFIDAQKIRRGWSLGIYCGRSPFELYDPRLPLKAAGRDFSNPVISHENIPEGVLGHVKGRAMLCADPFLVAANDQFHMFFEMGNQKGAIGHAVSADGLDWRFDQVVLSCDVHMSYPHVFEHEGEFYMIPETVNANQVRLYRARNFPYDWELDTVLLPNQPLADTSIVYWEGQWWLFSYDHRKNGLCLFHSENLRGPYTPHSGNPVVAGAATARNAGRLIVHEGALHRFSQDCVTIYGKMIRCHRVTVLTIQDYAEETIRDPFLRGSGRRYGAWNGKMHHIDLLQVGENAWIAAVDGADAVVPD